MRSALWSTNLAFEHLHILGRGSSAKKGVRSSTHTCDSTWSPQNHSHWQTIIQPPIYSWWSMPIMRISSSSRRGKVTNFLLRPCPISKLEQPWWLPQYNILHKAPKLAIFGTTTQYTNVHSIIPFLWQLQSPFGGFLSHRGTPVHHPFIDGILHKP